MSLEHGGLAEPAEELEQGRHEQERQPGHHESLEPTGLAETVREQVQEQGVRQHELLERLQQLDPQPQVHAHPELVGC